ncbi:autotransporter outer membrane beta-barrel domain-containing protein [Halomonas litopenaei]|nr:autotransporter outer membrane beta-barrel domain-containing protein [Halomonas litopenaei]
MAQILARRMLNGQSGYFAMLPAPPFTRRALGTLVAFLMSAPLPAIAANCGASGGLAFVGVTNDGSRSVWLSGTSPGDFGLEAAQGKQSVDEWTRNAGGLHLTLSPVVSNGNGGVHKLLDLGGNKDCLLDTQNQKGGFTLPPAGQIPMPERPGITPPIGKIFPDFSRPGGVTPPIGTVPPGFRPPTGVTPPVGTVPPGFGPPTGVTPPIGTVPPGFRPPTGVTPPVGTVPPNFRPPTGVTPPIGTVPPGFRPPTGVTPPIGTVPPGFRPPTGVTPPIGTVPPDFRPPTGVTPPIGTVPPDFRPPTGVTPPIGTVPPDFRPPTGVTPPIGTVPPGFRPPTGVTPPIGTVPAPERPPVGVTPGRPTLGQWSLPPNVARPGEVAPPIGVVPPDVRPPSGVTPPIGVVPPEQRPPSGLTPSLPSMPQGQIVGRVDAAEWYAGRVPLPANRCIDPRHDPRLGGAPLADGTLPVVTCPENLLRQHAQARTRNALEATLMEQVPITAGRQGEPVSPWNTWVDARYTDISDDRDGQDLDGEAQVVAVGVDRWVSEQTVAGGSFSVDSSRSDNFGGAWDSDSDGFSISPYVAYRLSERWALDASLIWRWGDNDTELATLEGSFDTRSFGGALNAHGQYRWGEALLRPTVSLFYSRERSDDYDLDGKILGIPVEVEVPGDSYSTGVASVSGELSRIYHTDHAGLIMPYAELGVDWAFEQPNDGRYLNEDLEWEDPSDLTGTLRTGARWFVGEATLLEASAGYLSIGHDDLDIWEGRLYLSYRF